MVATPTRAETETPLRLSARSPRRWRSVAAALALITIGGGTAMVALAQVDDRIPVLVAAQDLPSGHRLASADVRVVHLAGADGLPTVTSVDQAVGATLTVPLNEGALVAESALGADGDQLAENEAAVGAHLAAGRIPASVRSGARVVVVLTGEDGGDVSYPAMVQSLTPLSEDAGSEVVVELVLDASHAATVVRAAAEDRIALVHTPNDGGGQ